MNESVTIKIDILTFEGLTQEESRRAASVFKQTLHGLLDSFGLPEGKTASDISRIDLGTLSPNNNQTPERMGRELARKMFDKVWL